MKFGVQDELSLVTLVTNFCWFYIQRLNDRNYFAGQGLFRILEYIYISLDNGKPVRQ